MSDNSARTLRRIRPEPTVDEVVPGVLLARGFHRARGARGIMVPTAMIGCAGSVVIEVGQVFIPGRVPDATDVVLNSLGVGVSIALVGLWEARHAAQQR